MERIGIALQGNIILTGNGADFRLVSRHERVCRTFLKGNRSLPPGSAGVSPAEMAAKMAAFPGKGRGE